MYCNGIIFSRLWVKGFPLKEKSGVIQNGIWLQFSANQFSTGKVKGKDCLFGLGSYQVQRQPPLNQLTIGK
jgi:hypothetical protein